MKDKKTLINPRAYPVVIREREGYLVVSQPDLGITNCERRFSEIETAHDIGMIILEVMRKTNNKIIRLQSEGHVIPIPTQFLERDVAYGTDLFKVGDVAAVLGLSAKTIHRAIKAGSLRVMKTPRGHNRITYDELMTYKAKLFQTK